MAGAGGGTVRKLVVEVVEARGLLPKDGSGASSAYVVVDFDGQRKRTQTVHRDLNPVWNDVMVFDVSEAAFKTLGGGGLGLKAAPDVAGEPLEVDVHHDKRVGTSRIRNTFLGRVRLDSRQFVRKGEEALMHFPLQKKSFFSWVRGEIGLKIYYMDVPVPEPSPPPPHPEPSPPPQKPEAAAAAAAAEASPVPEAAARPEGEGEAGTTAEKPEDQPSPQPPPPEGAVEAVETEAPPATEQPADAGANPEAAIEEVPAQAPADITGSPPEDVPATNETPTPDLPPPETASEVTQPPEQNPDAEETTAPPPPPPLQPRPSLRPMHSIPPTPRTPETPIERSSFDLVEKMQYLFVRVVRARGIPSGSKPHVRLTVHGRHASTRAARKTAFFEWDQTFAFPRHEAAVADSPLEIAVWDLPPDADVPDEDDGRHFLGGLCFDTSEVPIRDPPDSPLATQWFKLEGQGRRRGDLMIATWIGTQADESFHHAWKVEDGASSHGSSRSKIYVSPKLWYLRLTVIEAQDLCGAVVNMARGPPVFRDASPVSAKVTVGFQTMRTRFSSSRSGSPSWNEDLIFVVAEPFGDQMVVISLENRHGKDQPFLGTAAIPLSSIERRVDDRLVSSRWIALDGGENMKQGMFGGAGRVHVRVCLDGGYHVAEEPAHAASDYRPSARQLWGRPIGALELGIIGCRGLLPMKTVQWKGSTDAYAVAKYGPKWARTRTIAGNLDPSWNEQYTWEVYDPSTSITVAVFDDDDDNVNHLDPLKGGGNTTSRPIGRVRIRISTLESGKPYRSRYPLLLLLPIGVKRMGELELAVRFTRAASSLDMVHLYTHPMLPAMHHLRPIPSPQREPLRSAAARIVAAHLSRSEPSLKREVVTYMLEVEGPPRYSMRKVRINLQRITASMSWAVDIARWVDETRTWRHPTSTLLAHGVLVLLVCYPDLIVPAVALHVSAVGIWKYRGRPRGPAAGQVLEGQAAAGEYVGAVAAEELDEELDTVPSGKGNEVVRARYERLRAVAARVQGLTGDVAAQGERVQALVTWRDPRATAMFVVLCFLVSALLYVVPMKVVAVGLGFYYLRHPVLRDRMPPPAVNFFRRLPSLSDRYL